MKVQVNGEDQELAGSLSVSAFLEEIGMDAPRGVAIAVNDTVVPRSKWEEVRLQEGDTVEIIRATQGG